MRTACSGEDNASLNTVQLLGVEDYNRAFGASQVLAEDEALLWCTDKKHAAPKP